MACSQAYMVVTPADRERLKKLAREDRTTVSRLLRAALNDYLEAAGEPPLESSGASTYQVRHPQTKDSPRG